MTLMYGTTSTTAQVTGQDPNDQYILSVLAKRTYDVDHNGHCTPSEEQVPLVLEPEGDPVHSELLVQDCDLFPFKRLSDVVIKGHAYLKGASRGQVQVQINNHTKTLLVTGDRRCALDSNGQIIFSSPASVEKIPLRYTHAYGGRDAVAEFKYGNPFLELQEVFEPRGCDLNTVSPFLYPRNPCGKGYLMRATRPAVEALQLPNLEDPLDPLTPQRLEVGDLGRWPGMPLPQATDWCDYGWFPRMSFLGLTPDYDPLDQPIEEINRGFASSDLMMEKRPDADSYFHFINGASLGLQLPLLDGRETCTLQGMHPGEQTWSFRLPGEIPQLKTDGRKGKFNDTDPVIHTLLIEPDDNRVTVLWRGCAPAIRAYLDEELERMPYQVDWQGV